MTFNFIMLATLAGGVLSVLAAAVLSLSILGRFAPRLVSFSVGVLLSVAFLDIIPEANDSLPAQTVGGTVLAGLLAFFLLEKLALWQYDHSAPECRHAHSPAGAMIMLGDGVHNFVDGILIAAAFLQNQNLGIATTIAVIAHEIPHEVGDFMVLLASGYSRTRALVLNLISGTASILGGAIGYFTLKGASSIIPHALCIAAASFNYVAVADMVPALQQQRRPSEVGLQIVMLIAGLFVVLAGHHVR